MSRNGSSRRLLAGAVALVMATVVGPLVVPVAAEAVSGPGTARPDTAGVTTASLPPNSRVVTAGATGFLSISQQADLLWTRYADGATTALGRDTQYDWPTPTHGYASDVVALERGTEYDAAHHVELHDMAAGTVTTLALGTTREFLAAAGSTVVTCAFSAFFPDVCKEAHLLDAVDGTQQDRKVAGLPADTTTVGVKAAGPGSVVLMYRTATGGDTLSYAVLDLASGTATPTSVPSAWAVALSPTRLAAVTDADRAALTVQDRATGEVTRLALGRSPRDPIVGLLGNWALTGDNVPLGQGERDVDLSLKALPLFGGAARRLLDRATSLTAAPDGSLLVMGATLAQGEGVYRVTAGADGAPAVAMVAGTGRPAALALLSSSVPAVATLDPSPWKPRWQLSRGNAAVVLTLRNTATGTVSQSSLAPSDPSDQPVRMDFSGLISLDWTGWTDSGMAPNGAYTWQITAKPSDGLGPDLTISGTFTVAREPAPHDYTDNGSPDLLVRDSAGVLWREDTEQVPWDPRLFADRARIGAGWNTYTQIVAAGNVAGGSGADVVARDAAGVLWLYLGTGKGTFTARTRVGAGWNTYTEITAGGDFTGDGRADLLARDHAGVLWLYKGTGNSTTPYAAPARIGAGWNTYTRIVAAGNVAGGSGADVVARDAAGVLWLYLGTGKGTFTARTRIGGGWNTYTQIVGVGDSSIDGKPDLLAQDRDGTTWRYRGTGTTTAPFSARDRVSVESRATDTIA